MPKKSSLVERRKSEHLEVFRRGGGLPGVGAATWFDHVHLVHQALPELNLAEVDLSTTFAGKPLSAPLFITGMTGGTREARGINLDLAEVAQEFGIGFGVGSQRAMLEDPSLARTYQVRSAAPDVFLAANLGGVQLTHTPMDRVADLVTAIHADALCIHLNPAQELAQPEGDRAFRGILAAIERLVARLRVPVMVKETGSGLNRETAVRLRQAGVRHIDVAGAGGTSWVGVEVERRSSPPQVRGTRATPKAKAKAVERSGHPAGPFLAWGIPTAASLLEVRNLELEVVASGGIRTGLDIAKSLALGATLAGLAAPLIRAWFAGGGEAVREHLRNLLTELRTALLLTGCATVAEARTAPFVLTGPLRDWMEQRCAGDGGCR
jgi:isopentenyl-diphosphate delta-isomerase